MTGIDLDVVPVTATGRRPPRWRRWPAVTAISVAALLLGGGAAPVRRPWDRPVTLDAVPPGGMVVVDDSLYLVRPDGVVTAYAASGEKRWSVPLGAANLYHAEAVADLVVLGGITGGADPGSGFTVAVEAATGVPRWRRSGAVRLIDRAAGLVVIDEPSRQVARPRASYRLLELATGRDVWPWATRPVDETLTPVADDGGRLAGLLQRDASGRTLLLDAGTRQDRLLADAPRVADAYRSGDDLLLLTDGTGAQLVMYDWETLRPRWRVAAPVGPLSGRCGPWLCVVDEDGTAAVDPATGQVRWRHSGVPAVVGQPLVLHEFGGTAARLTLADPTSGRPLLELPGWTGIGAPAAGRQVASRWSDDGRNHIVAVELASRRVQPVTTVVVATDSCASSGLLLACRGPGTLTMWRLG
ncbi:outer membrane protein assembly factor BamB family protein [Phytohabitans houttuyneae]|uniref:Pyrrolo-quinoline quinone repeat domain-containing protein n=1 Tax=Phytohabitans houttuyneae TaxID=1076126 RepID=A0A6V8KDM8_9ACTN|nr:PQQ-binding-like beta-propeller repeat protein [Phytohabitans houttuyneae]GFJ81550.1 hypothetical protein Phou_057300 [Phytohabitans houttuyneae]